MAYLPITALATIFALPVFDFKARWRDMYNQPANWSESSGDDNPDTGSPSSSSPPIMSIYFTYWISTSLVLTWLTIECWWVLSSEVEEWRWDRFLSLRQLARTAERLDELWSWVSKTAGKLWLWVSKRVGETRSWFVLCKVKFHSWWQSSVGKQPDNASIA
ncbi:hypothetical protein CDV36_006436 [Fusarium kuroshium]|uniref:Uncharacterized protein n=1 Tax=Fusarium kuroshium TaxID=2010991 RepID=A0A3M2S8K6_9HYPO|nr:hypothetical protein CDV36_006436 [Fusarium kuroshium]